MDHAACWFVEVRCHMPASNLITSAVHRRASQPVATALPAVRPAPQLPRARSRTHRASPSTGVAAVPPVSAGRTNGLPTARQQTVSARLPCSGRLGVTADDVVGVRVTQIEIQVRHCTTRAPSGRPREPHVRRDRAAGGDMRLATRPLGHNAAHVRRVTC